jgi:hypothetical protein
MSDSLPFLQIFSADIRTSFWWTASKFLGTNMSSKIAISLLALIPFATSLTLPEKRQSTLTVYTLNGWQSLGCWRYGLC